MMLRLTVSIPAGIEDEAINVLAEAAAVRQGITINTGRGHRIDVDLVNIDTVPEGRLIQ